MVDASIDEPTWLTYREAAVRVRRSVRTLWRWRKQGMPMAHGIRDGQRVRLVREDVLLAWWRDKLKTAPVEYYRRRRRAREQGLPDPEPPASLNRYAADAA